MTGSAAPPHMARSQARNRDRRREPRPVPGRRMRLRYPGAARNNAWLHTRCAAISLRTLLRHGLTRRDGAWVLA